jgi:hypothetical protein
MPDLEMVSYPRENLSYTVFSGDTNTVLNGVLEPSCWDVLMAV